MMSESMLMEKMNSRTCSHAIPVVAMLVMLSGCAVTTSSGVSETQSHKRSQEPVPPLPYVTQEVVFESSEVGIFLSGTVTRPHTDRRLPAVVLVSGSGQQNRDVEVFGHRPFLVIADSLTRAGFVVLRYDDRGIGGSSGLDTIAQSTTETFAADAAGAIRWMRDQPYVNHSSVGLFGHSEGALVASMLALERSGSPTKPSFVVLVGGSSIPGHELMLLQVEAYPKGSR